MNITQWKRLKPHPLALLFPRPSEPEQQAMTDGMKDRGWDKKHPIIISEGKILDGVSRFDSAKESGVEPSFDEYKGNDQLGFVITCNLHRRHMNQSQRAMVAATIAERRAGGDHSANLPNAPTQEKAAETLSVSTRSVTEARKVIREGTEELQEGVRDGTLSVSDAAKIVDQPPAKQRSAVNRVRKGKAKTVRETTGKHAGQSMADKAKQRLANRQGASAAPKDDGECTAHRCPSCGHEWEGGPRPERIKRTGFVPPTPEEVTAAFAEIDGQSFVDHYTLVGWRYGKANKPISDWKAAARQWLARQKKWDAERAGKNGKKKDTEAERAAFIAGLPPIPGGKK